MSYLPFKYISFTVFYLLRIILADRILLTGHFVFESNSATYCREKSQIPHVGCIICRNQSLSHDTFPVSQDMSFR